MTATQTTIVNNSTALKYFPYLNTSPTLVQAFYSYNLSIQFNKCTVDPQTHTARKWNNLLLTEPE